MKTLKYYVLDVFSYEKYKGNPLAVVCCDEDLQPVQYSDIAREFGYAETSFVQYSSPDKAFKVWSFTPGGYEVSGAGHNLLGAVCLAILKKWNIFNEQTDGPHVIMKDKKIPLIINYGAGTKQPFVGMMQQPAVIIKTVPADLVAEALGLVAEAVTLYDWVPTIVQTEVAHLMVPIKNNGYLKQAVPNNDLLKKISWQYGFEGFYLYTTDSSEKGYIAETRFFNPAFGIDEDPATGTAAGPLAGYLNSVNHILQAKPYHVLQGVLLNHASSIQVKVEPEGIWVSGTAVIVMEGELYL